MNDNSKYELVNVESFSQTFREIGKQLANCVNSLAKSILTIWESVKESMIDPIFNKKISRKRFIKLIMSKGIQRNQANILANKYHKRNGGYTFGNVLIEWRNIQKNER